MMQFHFNSILGYARGICRCSGSVLRPMLGMPRNEGQKKEAQNAFRNFYAAYRTDAFSECAYASIFKSAGTNLSIEIHQPIK